MRVMTLGTFDLFHAGHVELLRHCHRLAHYPGPKFRAPVEVIVGLNTDEFVESYKGQPPVIPWADRAAVLEACRYVKYVQDNPLRGRTQAEGISLTSPDVIAVGSDWQGKDYLGQLGIDQAFLNERGIQIVYVPRPNPPRISTSEIRGRVVAAHHYERCVT